MIGFFLAALAHLAAGEEKIESLGELNEAASKSGQSIKLSPGKYDIGDLPAKARRIVIAGSNNRIDLTDVHINATVGEVNESYIVVTGDGNRIIGGEVEDTYRNGLQEVTDFSAYNQDRENLANGLRAPVMRIEGDHNSLEGLKMTTRGSFPYGYGSYYGIGRDAIFGLDKRSGILITGNHNILDKIELQMRSFGHGIVLQQTADHNVIKNTRIEGRVRRTTELYEEKADHDLPKRTDYKIPRWGNIPLPRNGVHSLSEDGIRMYAPAKSVTVENCMVTKMRGGIRLYLGKDAIVRNCRVQYCEWVGYNLPDGGQLSNCAGDFSFGPLTDYRLNRSGTKAEWTILPSPHATGDHNIMEIGGRDHHITLNRHPGPLDTGEERTILVTAKNSTIINHTEYSITLAKGTTGNVVSSFGEVRGDTTNNTVTGLSGQR
ncbi:protein-transmembrane prediction [Haloferula sp. A504]|uniref:protein-transmembrane prediction n=1 Tax=Haloferula sp. A504 TaxID=3373601 RepID=UPI0031BE558D|nr:right-handed parallel beta-helix repeat-containing protein [Verrucomicrobiaceae bacterium E54]